MYPYNTPYKAANEINEISAPDRMFTDLLLEAMADEATEMRYYDKLRGLCVDPEDKELLRQISMDGKKHLKLLTNVYQTLLGEVPTVMAKDKPIGGVARAEYGRCVLNTLEAVEFYRKLYLMNKSPEIKDILLEVFTDKQVHATKMGYLFAKG